MCDDVTPECGLEVGMNAGHGGDQCGVPVNASVRSYVLERRGEKPDSKRQRVRQRHLAE